ncbi:hypothetical protein TWF281_010771 [Arthrobotrys megalospora]
MEPIAPSTANSNSALLEAVPGLKRVYEVRNAPGYSRLTSYVDDLFKECKTSNQEQEYSYRSKTSNADLSLPAISKLLEDYIPSVESVTMDAFQQYETYCEVSYTFMTPNAECPHRLSLSQCDTEEVAERLFKKGLGGFTAPRHMWPKPLNLSDIGHYAIGDIENVRWVRYTIFASLGLSEGILLKGNYQLTDVARALDYHFTAGSAKLGQKIVPEDCFVESGRYITVQSGKDFVVKARKDDDHHGMPRPWVEDWRMATMQVPDRDRPGEMIFTAGRVGTVMIKLVPVHKNTLHRSSGTSVWVTIV